MPVGRPHQEKHRSSITSASATVLMERSLQPATRARPAYLALPAPTGSQAPEQSRLTQR